MHNIQIKSRVKLLKLMHEIMMNMNHEEAYMTWIYIVPDEPSDDDFEYIAEDDDDFNEVVELFQRLFDRYKKYE